jgi:hypothetical protein
MNPLSVVKSNVNLKTIIGFAITAMAVFAIADFLGLTAWIINPVSAAKAKFGKNAG